MDTVKFIVNILNKAPFNKNYEIIQFDSLSKEELLQVLSDVLAEIEAKNKVDVHLEDPEQTVIRLFHMLRIIKYKPPANVDSIRFKQGLILGDKSVIHPILKWIFTNMEEIKNRAYLAKFLTKIEIPNDILDDADIRNLYDQYEQLIEEFKKVHRESTLAKGNKTSTSELKSDCAAIEREKEIISNRIYELQKRVQQMPNKTNYLTVAHDLRVEKERKKMVSQQIREEVATIQQSQNRLSRLTQQLNDLKKYSVNLSPEGILKKLEEEVYVTTYIGKQKLPRELNEQKKELDILESVINSAKISEVTNGIIITKIQSISQQLNNFSGGNHSTSTASSTAEDKNSLYKQQAAIVARKKDSIAEQFSQFKNELSMLDNELYEKKQKLQALLDDVGVVLNNDEFQDYVQKLRARSVIYKHHRSQLALLKSEEKVLSKTLSILQTKEDRIKDNIDPKFLNDSEFLNEPNNNDTEVISDTELFSQIAQLTTDISMKKTKLMPLINEIKPLQDLSQQLKTESEDKKIVYDRTSAMLDSNLAKLTRDVKELQEERKKVLMESHLLEEKAHIDEVNLQRANNELKAYTDKNNTTPTLRDRINLKLGEGEKYGNILKEEQKQLIAKEEELLKQKELWNNLYQLMECKWKCLQIEKENSGVFHKERGAETLILQ